MSDFQKTVEGYKQLYKFLIEFNKMNLIKRNIVIKQLEGKIKELESEENGNG